MKKNKFKNHGFYQEKEMADRQESDWIFGATSSHCIAEIPEEKRETYLPAGEVQRGTEDTMDCASRGPINILEAKFTWLVSRHILSSDNEKWLQENGYYQYQDGETWVNFSDCFVAQNSGTTRQGNSLVAPLQAIHEFGLIPKAMLPLELWMAWSDYHDPKRITKEMRDLGLEFTKRFLINYERVLEKDAETLLKQDFQDIAGYAWPEPINSEYPRTEADFNHVFIAFKTPMYYIFDNYINPMSKDFIKKLASDYKLYEYGYRIFITELKVAEIPPINPLTLWGKLSRFYQSRFCSSPVS